MPPLSALPPGLRRPGAVPRVAVAAPADDRAALDLPARRAARPGGRIARRPGPSSTKAASRSRRRAHASGAPCSSAPDCGVCVSRRHRSLAGGAARLRSRSSAATATTSSSASRYLARPRRGRARGRGGARRRRDGRASGPYCRRCWPPASPAQSLRSRCRSRPRSGSCATPLAYGAAAEGLPAHADRRVRRAGIPVRHRPGGRVRARRSAGRRRCPPVGAAPT